MMYDHFDDIENEFKEIHESHEDPDQKHRKIYTKNLYLYLVYMLLPFILSVFIVLTLMNNTYFFKPLNPSQNAIESASLDVNSLLIVKEEHFETLDTVYRTFFIEVGTDTEHSIYINSASRFMTDEIFFTQTESDGRIQYHLNNDIFNEILAGTITAWPNHAKITFYVPIDDVSPQVAGTFIDHSSTLIASNKVPTIALDAIYFFILVTSIAIPIVYISMPVIKEDFQLLTSNNQSYGSAFGKVGIGILYMLAANIAAGIIIDFISLVLKTPNQISSNQLSIEFMLKSPYSILMIISAVIIAPIFEELVFRKSIFGLIKNQNWALVISSVVFGLVHITNELLTGNFGVILTTGIPYIVAGFVFGYVYKISRKNVLVTIMLHMANNLLSILMVFL